MSLVKKLFHVLINCPRWQKHLILYFTDSILFFFATYLALIISSPTLLPLPNIQNYIPYIIPFICAKLFLFTSLGLYRGIIRYTEFGFLYTASKSVFLGQGLLVLISFILPINVPINVQVQVIDALITLGLITNIRLIARWLLYSSKSPVKLTQPDQANIIYQPTTTQTVIIYGAGQAGFQLYQALHQDKLFQVVAFVDDNEQLWKHVINGIQVHSPQKLQDLINSSQVNLVLLAIPSTTPQRKQQILTQLQNLGVEVKTVPTLAEIISGKVSIAQVRKIDICDILGREEVLPNKDLLVLNITGKSVLVTGAGGSIGAELCRQIAQQQPRHLVLYELNEFALYSIEIELRETYPDLSCVACLGSVSDYERIKQVINKYEVETIYHAAAYKHVPLVESNPVQGVINNIYGTLVTVKTANECKVDTFVLISTDKAVRPTNIMGATKRVAELILQGLSKEKDTHTRLMMVRFGNVLNSTGSVVPRFQKQIANRQPITITHPDIIRYFMSIPEAARLVIQAGALGKGGEVFLLDMGEPIRIYDLAVQMVELSGLVIGKDIEIQITGLRPGEKLYEELLIEDGNAQKTIHPKIYAAKEAMIPWNKLESYLDQLFLAANSQDTDSLLSILKIIVPEYLGVRVVIADPRPGDPACVTADAQKIKQVLNWQPKHEDLDEIIASTIDWEKSRPT
ncbi:MAG: polysaccharide biosynthesis protein [Cylindrospermopsis raciborskii PAMP2012]|uniref:polysaccharide biosynthesis protein n=1 Tax=Cylindrospermopsis raciborskii TaxID=77022 RepID=UPI0022C1914C|nr:polysaccharide biosynthesis protein [Cylindrospermopsis raciborskii]MCZ2203170.1 polysaccharide biosynthesis protein [Cylindrospermopsis raciborskii PAMP2012]